MLTGVNIRSYLLSPEDCGLLLIHRISIIFTLFWEYAIGFISQKCKIRWQIYEAVATSIRLSNLCWESVKLSGNMDKHCLDTFLEQFGKNLPEFVEIFSLVLNIWKKLSIVDKFMLIYNEHRVVMYFMVLC